MDLKSRIRRRMHSGSDSQLVLDYDAINPTTHIEDPIGRGSVLERLLDYIDPMFTNQLPPNAYVWGPAGSGKSAVLTALVTQLDKLHPRSRAIIHTATRAQSNGTPAFVYVDARRARSDFGLHRAILDNVLDESVPEHGVGGDAVRSRLEKHLLHENQVLVAVDHVDEPNTFTLSALRESLSSLGSLSWVAVGRTAPSELSDESLPPKRIEIPSYDDHVLVDILTERASDGLAQRAVTHEQLRRLVDWGEGNAHDTLAALCGSADVAVSQDQSHIRERDLQVSIDAVPRPSVSLGRVLTLSDTRQSVLRCLVDLNDSERAAVDTATETIAQSNSVDLSQATVKRFLYELAETGIIERVTNDGTGSIGRPPSRLEPRFPTLVFQRLYGLEQN